MNRVKASACLAQVFFDVIVAAVVFQERGCIVSELRPIDGLLDRLVVVELADLPEVNVVMRLADDFMDIMAFPGFHGIPFTAHQTIPSRCS